jgi:hypothetical protein
VSLFLPPPCRQPLIDIHTHPWPGGGSFLRKNPPPSVGFEPTSAGTATSEHCSDSHAATELPEGYCLRFCGNVGRWYGRRNFTTSFEIWGFGYRRHLAESCLFYLSISYCRMQKMKIHLRSDTRFFLSTLEPAESCYFFAVTKLRSPSYPGPLRSWWSCLLNPTIP